jgi:hypothetical protein
MSMILLSQNVSRESISFGWELVYEICKGIVYCIYKYMMVQYALIKISRVV